MGIALSTGVLCCHLLLYQSFTFSLLPSKLCRPDTDCIGTLNTKRAKDGF